MDKFKYFYTHELCSPLIRFTYMNDNFKGIWIDKTICMDNKLNSAQKMLMGILLGLSKNDDNESCFPNNKTLSELTGLTIRGVQKNIKYLIDHEYIEIDIGAHNKRTIYIMHESDYIPKPIRNDPEDYDDLPMNFIR